MFRKRGQSMTEYSLIMPIGLAIILVASALSGAISDGFQQTADALTGDMWECDDQGGSEEGESESEKSGPRSATVGGHTVELLSDNYDKNTDMTTVTYRVTSNGPEVIRKVDFQLPAEAKNNITSVSESYKTFGYGLRLKKHYKTNPQRNVTITFSGKFEFESVELRLKYGSENKSKTWTTSTSSITAPVRIDQQEEESGECGEESSE